MSLSEMVASARHRFVAAMLDWRASCYVVKPNLIVTLTWTRIDLQRPQKLWCGNEEMFNNVFLVSAVLLNKYTIIIYVVFLNCWHGDTDLKVVGWR